MLPMLFIGSLSSQKYYNGKSELGLLLGVSSYYGDLFHGYKTAKYYPSAAVYFQRNYRHYFSWRIAGSYLSIGGTDKGNAYYAKRNLSFYSNIYELSNNVIFNFRPFGTNINDERSTLYVVTGLNLFMFDPKDYNNRDIRLQPLKTDATLRYWRLQPCIPIGLGYKIKGLTRRGRGANVLGIEAVWRKTITDNLDDVSGTYTDYTKTLAERGTNSAQYSHAEVSAGRAPYPSGMQRGDLHLKDWYYFVGFSFSFRLTPEICR